MWVDIYIYIYAVVYCRFFSLILLLLLLLFLFPLWIPRSLALSLHSSAVHPKPRPACMHTAAYTFISDIFWLLLLMRTYLSSSVPPCQEKNFHIFMGGLNLFSPQFIFFWFYLNYFHWPVKGASATKPWIHSPVIIIVFTIPTPAGLACILNRQKERELYYLLHSDPKERERVDT